MVREVRFHHCWYPRIVGRFPGRTCQNTSSKRSIEARDEDARTSPPRTKEATGAGAGTARGKQARAASPLVGALSSAPPSFLSPALPVRFCLPSQGRLSFLLFASRCASRSFFLLAPRCAVRHTRPQAKTRSLSRAMPARKQKHARSALASAHTDDRRTDEATCGPQAWLTGRLHEGGIRSVRSPLRRAPLLATPIAKPLQCGRP